MEEKNNFLEFLKYVDCFGTEFNFYTEKNRKFYTPLGGILTLISILFGIFVFIAFNYTEFIHANPMTSTFILRENYSNIKFGEEKIWIPWRIRDYQNKKVDHQNFFYPLIYYYKGIKNETTQGMDLTYDFIDYKLCNETSMVNRSDLYLLNMSLDNVYCIDMEDLDVGGNWQGDFINYIEFDLYICEDGINYNETDVKCTTYERIINSSLNNSYEMEIFFPVVYYEPTNKLIPIIVKYSNSFYHFSRYTNKIDRLFLQKYIFYDDVGLFGKEIKEYSYWGESSLKGDSYATTEGRDLMNEGSTSRLYSLNIYLNSDIICYTRSHKKLMIIIAESLPIINVVFVLLGLIAKLFKISAGNMKLTELLFVNIKEKWKRFNDEQYNKQFNKMYKSKSGNKSFQLYKGRNSKIKYNDSNSNIPEINKPIYNINNNNKNNNLNENEASSLFYLNHQQSLNNNNILIKNENEKKSIDSKNNEIIKYARNSKNLNYSNIISNESFNKTINNININIRNNPDNDYPRKNRSSDSQRSKNTKKLKKENTTNKEKY